MVLVSPGPHTLRTCSCCMPPWPPFGPVECSTMFSTRVEKFGCPGGCFCADVSLDAELHIHTVLSWDGRDAAVLTVGWGPCHGTSSWPQLFWSEVVPPCHLAPSAHASALYRQQGTNLAGGSVGIPANHAVGTYFTWCVLCWRIADVRRLCPASVMSFCFCTACDSPFSPTQQQCHISKCPNPYSP